MTATNDGPVDRTADLQRFDVLPFPLATAVHWTDAGYEIELVVVTEAHDSGYSSIPIASQTVAYANGRPPEEGPAASAELDDAVRAALALFAERLARALRE
jgi:hypothetical protein